MRNKLATFYDALNNKFLKQFGFKIEEVTYSRITNYLHTPRDSSSLAVTRILFGLAMLFDIPDERGGASMEKRWGDPKTCHFPLIPFIQAVSMPYMAVIYAGLWFGAMGIMLGYKYRASAATFTVCYWYLLLVEKSYWNNHSYLFGLVALLLTCTEAGCYWSIDTFLDPSKSKREVPYWNYFILKYQFFILYFMAGLKKGTAEWLTGYSVQNLSEHWVFEPFKLVLTVPQTDYLIVHWFVFMFDLTVALWMMCSKTRNVAMVFCAMFHLMNSRLFRIGMFPWVCLATMPLFYPFDWPKTLPAMLIKIKARICKIISTRNNQESAVVEEKETKANYFDVIDGYLLNDLYNEHDKVEVKDVPEELSDENEDKSNKGTGNYIPEMNGGGGNQSAKKPTLGYDGKKVTVLFIIFHVLSQAFLPFSHFITQGYNNWTNGLYGYSWDMMVHTWDTHAVIVKIVDNENQNEFFMDPYTYAPNERWTRHGDMVHQYARCLKKNLAEDAERFQVNNKRLLSDNISIYVDVWCSMNGRFTQRIFDPKVDILAVAWSPFQKVSYLLPLLEAMDWRADLERMKKEVHSWNNYSDVIFLADFPGYEQDKYVSEDLKNVTLAILQGEVAYQPEVTKFLNGYSMRLTSGDRLPVDSGVFHKVLNIGQEPAFYMYSFYNSTDAVTIIETPKLPILKELYIRLYNLFSFGSVMLQSFWKLFACVSNC